MTEEIGGAHPYEYHGLMASTWDLFRGDTSGWEDRSAYLDLIRRHGQPVLDVGCGTGRLLLDFMGQGVDIDGVDLSPEMLALCRDRAGRMGLAPALHQSAMEELELTRRYRIIMVPSSSFQLLVEPSLARRAMERFHDHLVPGGVLVMPFMILWKPGDPEDTGWALTGEKFRPEDGAVVLRWSRARYDPPARLEHTWDRYRVVREGILLTEEEHQRSPATRWYGLDEARDLFRRAGFEEPAAYQAFSQIPAQSGDKIFTLVGSRPVRTNAG
ncbi:MAG: class I SAM-dependent methyltransferase [Anaerolineales bacterium]